MSMISLDGGEPAVLLELKCLESKFCNALLIRVTAIGLNLDNQVRLSMTKECIYNDSRYLSDIW